jgi:hypothetical protein
MFHQPLAIEVHHRDEAHDPAILPSSRHMVERGVVDGSGVKTPDLPPAAAGDGQQMPVPDIRRHHHRMEWPDGMLRHGGF